MYEAFGVEFPCQTTVCGISLRTTRQAGVLLYAPTRYRVGVVKETAGKQNHWNKNGMSNMYNLG